MLVQRSVLNFQAASIFTLLLIAAGGNGSSEDGPAPSRSAYVDKTQRVVEERQSLTGAGVLGAGAGVAATGSGLLSCHERVCDQTITGRNLTYARALEIVQQEIYLTAADLSILKRKKRSPIYYGSGSLSIDEGFNLVNTHGNTTYSVSAAGPALVTLLLVALTLQRPGANGQQPPVGLPPPPVPTQPIPSVAVPLIAPQVIVLPPPGQAPADQPQPGTPGGGSPPIPSSPAQAALLTLIPPGGVPVALFPQFQSPRTVEAVCVLYSQTDEESILAEEETRVGTARSRQRRGILARQLRKTMSSPYASVKRAFRKLFSHLGGRRTQFHSDYSFPAEQRQYLSQTEGESIGQPQRIVERRYGFICNITTRRRCILNVTCDANGNLITPNTQGLFEYNGLLRRQTGEEFGSVALPECRTVATDCVAP